MLPPRLKQVPALYNRKGEREEHSTMDQELLTPGKQLRRRHFWQRRDRRSWWLGGVAAVLLLTLALAVPLAVVLPKKKDPGPPPPASVILPLYIYPNDSTTWSPVYEA